LIFFNTFAGMLSATFLAYSVGAAIVSYEVTKMVRAARLPRTLKRRPVAKAVLFALADRWDDDGRNGWPSVRTIADEVEVSPRTVFVVLRALEAAGLIAEQAPPRQHRPRTWCLNVARLAALADPQHGATLSTTPTAPVSAPDLQMSRSDLQISTPDRQHVADDPVLLNGPLNGNTAAAPRSAPSSRAPAADGNFKAVVRLAHDVMDATGRKEPTDPDLIEALKQRCADIDIDYGRNPAVALDVVHRALNCAYMQRVVSATRVNQWPRTDGSTHDE
jgi:Helix-turn-helix domain